MSKIKLAVVVALAMLGSTCAGVAVAGPLDETRYCGVQRLENGKIKRSSSVVRAFKRVHPCPVTGVSDGPCPGWQVDHVVPLGCGGCDAVANMQWLPVEIKTCKGSLCKDRWELRMYCKGQ